MKFVTSQHLACPRTENRAFCFPYKQARDHGISKRPIDNFDIFVAMTFYKLARPLSGTEFCLRDQIHFQTQPRCMVCKDALFRMRLKPYFTYQNPVTRLHLMFRAQKQSRSDGLPAPTINFSGIQIYDSCSQVMHSNH